MIDAAWLLWSRVLLDYANAATTSSLARMRHNALTDMTDQTVKTNTINNEARANASKVGYAIIGFVYAVAAYQVSASIAAIVINSTGVTDWIKFSFLLQSIFGASISVIAYGSMSNRSIKLGMRVCYALVVGTLFVIGGYTVLTSLMNL